MVMDRYDTDELIEAWHLVDELGALSLRLRLAAQAAQEALGLTQEDDDA